MIKLLLLIILATLIQAQPISVVVSKNFDVADLSKFQVKRIFLSITNKVDSNKVKVYEIKNTSYKKEFYQNVSGKSLGQLRSYWARLIFTGKAQAPKQLQDVKELIAKMQEDNRVISYVLSSQITSDMRVLYTMED